MKNDNLHPIFKGIIETQLNIPRVINSKNCSTKKQEDKLKKLTCTQCGAIKEQYSSLVYSQGNLVCMDCKELNKESDKRAFDRDMSYR